MNSPRYILDKSSKKFTCPACGKRRFVPYIDIKTGEYLPGEFGRCDREINCGYFRPPEKRKEGFSQKVALPQPEPLPSFIPYETFAQSRGHYQENNFVQFLLKQFGKEKTLQVISRYNIGTSKHWPGACIFWQIDTRGRVHSGKIMLYNASTGHRIKEPFSHITWVHKALRIEPFNLKQCLFGEHLLKLNPGVPACIVESEKSAIIASLYFPGMNWFASGSLSNLSPERCQGLKGKEVILFPDLGAFQKWNEKAAELAQELSAPFRVSDLLEKNAAPKEREQGLDLADYLLRFSPDEFCEKNEAPRKTFILNDKVPEPIKPRIEIAPPGKGNEKNEKYVAPGKTFILREPSQQFPPWELSELEAFFREHPLSPGPVKLKPWESIEDVPLFVQNTLEFVKAQNGNPTFLPYLNQLQELKRQLICNLN